MKKLDYDGFNPVDGKELIYREYRELHIKKDSHKEKIEDAQKNNVFELLFYSNKIFKEDWNNFFKTLFKRRMPLFDFLDFSAILPFKSLKFIIKKNANTVRFYLKKEGTINENLSSLIFPFKLRDTPSIPLFIGFPFGIYIVGNSNLFSFLVKEDVEEISLNIFPFFGACFAIGTISRSNGSRKILLALDPSKFLEIDLEKNPSFYTELIDKPLLKSMYLASEDPIFESKNLSIGLNNFDVFKHSLILGMSGCGKSKFIYILTKAIKKKYGSEAKIVLIDPHGEFSKSFESEATIVDFKSTYIEPLEIGNEASPMTTQLIEDLIMSIISQKNKYADRVLFYSIHLLSSINGLRLSNISKLLTDSAKRMEYLSKTENEEIKRFFTTEFDDIYINHFNDAVLPLLNFVGEYELYMGKRSKSLSLVKLIEAGDVLVLSFDPHFFGRKMIKFLAGAVIQQMYILAVTNKLKIPTVLLVDEFPIVETNVVKNIHAETRKFNLHLYLSMQYLNQLDKTIIDSILTNVYNYIIFKCNRQDASLISSIMDIKVEEYFKKHRQPSELEEEKKDLFVNLTSRECVVRLFNGTQHLMPIKTFVTDLKNWEFFKLRPKQEPEKPMQISEYKLDDHEIIKGDG